MAIKVPITNTPCVNSVLQLPSTCWQKSIGEWLILRIRVAVSGRLKLVNGPSKNSFRCCWLIRVATLPVNRLCALYTKNPARLFVANNNRKLSTGQALCAFHQLKGIKPEEGLDEVYKSTTSNNIASAAISVMLISRSASRSRYQVFRSPESNKRTICFNSLIKLPAPTENLNN